MIAKYAFIETGEIHQKVWLNVKFIFLYPEAEVLN